jgi:hypothetical protein
MIYRYLAVFILVLSLASGGFYAVLDLLFPSLGAGAIILGSLFGPAILIWLFMQLAKVMR